MRFGFTAALFLVAACGKVDSKDSAATATATGTGTAPAAPAVTATGTQTQTATSTSTATATATSTATASATATSTAIATGSSGADKGLVPAILKDKVKLTIFGKSIYVENKLYDLDCNQFFVKFWASQQYPDCTAVNVTTDFKFASDSPTGKAGDAWTIGDPNVKINVQGFNETSTGNFFANARTYYCLLYSGNSAYKADGTEVIGNTHIIFTEKAASRPSDLDPASVMGIGFADSELCDARF